VKAAALACIAAAVALTACSGGHGTSGHGSGGAGHFDFHSATALGQVYPVHDRQPAGDISAPLLGRAGTFDLAQDRGEVVVLNYWASDCAPCRVESPQFDAVYRAYKDKGVDIVGVDFKDERASAKSFVRHNDISFPNVYDQQGRTALELGELPASATPFTVLIDRHGDVAGVYLGAMQARDLETVLDTVLAEA
jgi:thiol-disulfide isomerase/thioredoxin